MHFNNYRYIFSIMLLCCSATISSDLCGSKHVTSVTLCFTIVLRIMYTFCAM